MAFEMDEMKKRRQQREQKEQERLQQEKKTRVQLLIAVAILVACAILITTIRIAIYRSAEGEPTTVPTTQPVQTTTEETRVTREPTTVIHITAAGDLNITDKVVNSCGADYDYTETFMDVVPLLCEADLTVMNFEGSLCGVPYDGTSAPPQMLTALKNAGVDMLQLANSKTISRGFAGFQSTLQSVRDAGLISLGVFENKSEFEKTGGYTILQVRGVKVAVVAFTKGMDNMTLPVGSEKCVNLLYSDYSSTYRKVDTQGITRILRSIAREKPDVTIAMLHWGSEYNDSHSDSQKEIKDLMMSEGVDAIIGTHPHLVQEMEYDQDAGTFVAYSLGDFFGDASRAGTEYSVVLDLEITKDNVTGVTSITNFTYAPIFTAENPDGTLRVVRLQEAIADYEDMHINSVSPETYDSMIYGLSRIEDRVKPKVEAEE